MPHTLVLDKLDKDFQTFVDEYGANHSSLCYGLNGTTPFHYGNAVFDLAKSLFRYMHNVYEIHRVPSTMDKDKDLFKLHMKQLIKHMISPISHAVQYPDQGDVDEGYDESFRFHFHYKFMEEFNLATNHLLAIVEGWFESTFGNIKTFIKATQEGEDGKKYEAGTLIISVAHDKDEKPKKRYRTQVVLLSQ